MCCGWFETANQLISRLTNPMGVLSAGFLLLAVAAVDILAMAGSDYKSGPQFVRGGGHKTGLAFGAGLDG